MNYLDNLTPADALALAEKSVIGAMLTPRYNDRFDLDVLPGDFADPRCDAVCTIIQRMQSDPHAQIDAITVDEYARRDQSGDFRGVNGPFLHECIEANTNWGAVRSYVNFIQEEAGKRRLATGLLTAQQALADGRSFDECQQVAEKALAAKHDGSAINLVSANATMAETIAALRNPAQGALSPWGDLNTLTGGLQGGALYVVGARPGVGKSVVALQIALKMSEVGEVSFTSLEMGAKEINTRILAHDCKINMSRLQGKPDPAAGRMTEENWALVERHAASGHRNTLMVNDSNSATYSSIRKHARAVARRGKLTAVVVDYIQLINPEPGDNRRRHEQISEWSRNLKTLAMELDVPVVALAQLNRNSTHTGADGQEPLPKVSELRESGSLEQDADVVILLARPLVGPESGTMKMIVGKNRSGPAGLFNLDFYGHYSKAVTEGTRP